MIDFDYIDDDGSGWDYDDGGGGDMDGAGHYKEDGELTGRTSRAARRSATVSDMPETAASRAAAMLALLERPEWHEHAACSGIAGFFELPAAKAAERCAVCPVTEECRRAGLKQSYGVWDGEEKPGLEPVAHEMADRIIDLVSIRRYALTAKEITDVIRAADARRKAPFREKPKSQRLPKGTVVVAVCDDCGERFEFVSTFRPRSRCDACGTSSTLTRILKRLVDEGRLSQYETIRGQGRGRSWAIVYGPGEARR